MKRREFLSFAVCAAIGLPLAANAQSGRARRIGLMANLSLLPIERFRERMKQLGYVEGQNLLVEYRFAEGRDELYAGFAEELVSMPVELIVAWGTPAAFAAKRATSKIPVVITVGDVINTGLVSNLARPDANITGFVALNVELEEKRLELIKEIVPRLSKVAVLGNRANPLNKINSEAVRRVAERLSVSIDVVNIVRSDEVEAALGAIASVHPDAVIIASDTLLLSERARITTFMADNGIPAVYPFREYAEAGGFISYGANIATLLERAADYVHRILNGESPQNLPIQQATSFEMIINLKATAKLGLTLPPAVLARADEVIE
jgi:putative tryptophan/tyrosine transport system substrate-binding protein